MRLTHLIQYRLWLFCLLGHHFAMPFIAQYPSTHAEWIRGFVGILDSNAHYLSARIPACSSERCGVHNVPSRLPSACGGSVSNTRSVLFTVYFVGQRCLVLFDVSFASSSRPSAFPENELLEHLLGRSQHEQIVLWAATTSACAIVGYLLDSSTYRFFRTQHSASKKIR